MTILEDRVATRLTARPSRALSYLPVTSFLLDLALIAGTMVLGVLGRRSLGFFDTPADISSSVMLVAPILTLGWLVMIATFGGYRRDAFGEGATEFKRVATATVYTAGILGIICYLARYDLSRGFYVLAFVIGLFALLVGRWLLRRALHAARTRGALLQRVLLVGSAPHIDEVASVLRRERWLGYQIIGSLTPFGDVETETPTGVPVLGHTGEVRQLVEQADGADVVVFAGGGHFSAADLRQIQWDLERHDVQLVVAPSLSDMSSGRITIRPVGGLPLVHLEAPRWAHAGRWMKRAFDMLGSGMLILAASPILIFAALRIKIYDGGDVFFRQVRVGRFGEEFACFKFRTMVMNADALITRMQEEQGATALLFKVKEDPRITKPGKWLRRFSIDELPQLFNVFLGDMSLVGPRPQVPREVALYDDALRRRLNVRPGMTGLWQVSGRNDLSLEDSVRLDLYYIDNWSMLQDLSILMRTFGAVLSSRGAY